jgi:hypothetical protein
MVIILVAISGYLISGYPIGGYRWLSVAILLIVIGEYFIVDIGGY